MGIGGQNLNNWFHRMVKFFAFFKKSTEFISMIVGLFIAALGSCLAISAVTFDSLFLILSCTVWTKLNVSQVEHLLNVILLSS